MLYDIIKNPVWYDCNKQMAAIKFLLFLEWNNALFVDGEKRISDTLLVALILMDSGYHEQILSKKTIEGALKYITEYDYDLFHNAYFR